jgi:hypothetical protein
LPAAFQRIWWPQIVCREITENGMSLSPSSSCTAGTGLPNVWPPFVDFVTMIWLSKSNGTSHAAWFCPLKKCTYRSPLGATSGMENWSSSHSFAAPVVWNVQRGCEPEISFGRVHVSPPSSDQLSQIGDSAYAPCSVFRNREVVRYALP